MGDTASISSFGSTPSKQQQWLHKTIQKLVILFQTDENKKMFQVFLLDPILNHVFERLFPYILIMCVLFVILTIMISLTLLIVFTRIPGAVATVVG